MLNLGYGKNVNKFFSSVAQVIYDAESMDNSFFIKLAWNLKLFKKSVSRMCTKSNGFLMETSRTFDLCVWPKNFVKFQSHAGDKKFKFKK
jgi:hypothetical protein